MSVHIIKSWRTSQSSNFTVAFQFRPGMGYRFTTSWRESVRLLHSTVPCTTMPFFSLNRLFSFRSTARRYTGTRCRANMSRSRDL